MGDTYDFSMGALGRVRKSYLSPIFSRAIAALDRKNPDTATFVTLAARSQFGLVDVARAADLELAAAAADIRGHDPHARERLIAWLAAAPGWTAVVERQEPQSLFNAARL